MKKLLCGKSLKLRPHYKSHKCAEIAHEQIENFTCAKRKLHLRPNRLKDGKPSLFFPLRVSCAHHALFECMNVVCMYI